jgi:hypothetical protein
MAGGNTRTKGSDVLKIKHKNPNEIKPMTPKTRATIDKGKEREKNATALDQKPSKNTHNNKEP